MSNQPPTPTLAYASISPSQQTGPDHPSQEAYPYRPSTVQTTTTQSYASRPYNTPTGLPSIAALFDGIPSDQIPFAGFLRRLGTFSDKLSRLLYIVTYICRGLQAMQTSAAGIAWGLASMVALWKGLCTVIGSADADTGTDTETKQARRRRRRRRRVGAASN
jgi:hypothetical protein